MISFEGIDGSGKSTQARLLKEKLESIAIPVVMCREPGGTRLSEEIRRLLLDPSLEISPFAELLLFSAARAELVSTVIKPALESGSVVILDRFFDSTVAYQGAGRQLTDESWLDDFNLKVTGGLNPDRTFLIRVGTQVASDRMKAQPLDRMELTGQPFFDRVVRSYDTIADANPTRVCSIDGELPIEVIHDQVWQEVIATLGQLKLSNGTANEGTGSSSQHS